MYKIKKMESTILKSAAYDLLVQIEYLQKQLHETNQKIAEAIEKEQKEKSEVAESK